MTTWIQFLNKNMRRWKVIFTLILFCSALSWHSNAGAQTSSPLEVSSKVDKTVATVGDIITYTLTTNSAAGVQTVLPKIDNNLGGLEIIERGQDGPKDTEGRKISTYWYKLRISKIGTYTIPSLTLAYTLKGEPQDKQIQTNEITIEVKSVLAKGEELKDIVDIKPLQPLGIDYQFWIAIAVLTLIIAAIVGFIIYKRKQRGTPQEIVIKRPPHEVALEELNKLLQAKTFAPDEIKKLYFELSEIFRQYLEGRYSFPASEWTSEEILWHLNKHPELSFDQKGNFRDFFFSTDLVKFAKVMPAKEQVTIDIQEAIQFVENTKEIVEEHTEPGSAWSQD